MINNQNVKGNLIGYGMAKRHFFNRKKRNTLKLYEILEVQQDASQADIKKSFFRLAKKYHPDVNKSEGAQQKYVEINEYVIKNNFYHH